jgi:hypothetical protein
MSTSSLRVSIDYVSSTLTTLIGRGNSLMVLFLGSILEETSFLVHTSHARDWPSGIGGTGFSVIFLGGSLATIYVCLVLWRTRFTNLLLEQWAPKGMKS